MDSQGRPHIAYRETSTLLKYAYYDGTTWRGEKNASTPDTISTMTLGYAVSMALDSSGNPHIAFATNKTGTDPYMVRYASWNGSEWQATEVVQSNASYWTGVYVSLAIDGTTPHLSYIDCTTGGDSRSCSGRLMYATAGSSGWTTPTQVSAGTSVSGYTSLALDGSTPHIAYYEGGVYYASPGTSWTRQSVTSGTKELSLAIYNHVPRIAISGSGYAVLNAGVWTFPTPTTSIGGQPSLAIDNAGYPHVAYRGPAFGTTAIIHRWFDGTAWQTEPAGDLARTGTPPEIAAWYPSLALDSAGHARVSYFVQTNTPAYGDGPTVYAHLNQLTATDDSATVRQDATGGVSVLGNDTQLGFSGERTLSVNTPPNHGTAAISADGKQVVYDPADDYSGPDSLVYQVCDANGTPGLCTTATLNVTVQPVLQVTATESIIYGEEPGAIEPMITGFVNGEDASVLSTPPTCTAEGPHTAGTHKITCSGGVDENYAFAYTDGTLTVGQATLQVTATKSITYGEDPGMIEPTITGFVGNDDASVLATVPMCVADGPFTAGQHKITCFGGAAENYGFNYTEGTLTVDQAKLKVIADDQSITYGQPEPPLTFHYSGLVAGDDADAIDIAPTCTVVPAGPHGAGAYDIVCSGGGDPNYAFVEYMPGKLIVGQATVQVIADDQSITYGQPDPELTFHYRGFVPGDDASGIDTPPTCAVVQGGVHDAAGSPYDITCSGGVDDNYAFVYTPAKLFVGKATLEVTSNKTITYGEAPGVLTPSYSGLVGTDEPADIDTAPTCTLDVSGPYTAAGSPYGITCSGDVDDNYLLTFKPGQLTVGKANLTVTAADQSKTYGQSNPALTFAYSGFVFTDGQTDVDTAPTCATTATQYSPVAGSPYPITCSGGADENYAFTYVAGKLTITPAEALVSYVGETQFVSASSKTSTVQVTLTATLQAVDEEFPLGSATVDFIDEATGKVLAANVPVAPVAGNPNVGTANAITTLSTGQYGAESYLIQVVATGNYENSDQPDEDKTAVVVAMKPGTTNTIVGVGTMDPLAPAGSYAGDLDKDVTFTIGLQYNKSGTNPQGKIVLTIPQADGSLVFVKSNAISSMKVDPAKTTATIYTKASLYRLDHGVVTSIDGNVTLRMDVQEMTGTADLVGFTVLSSKDSTLYFSNQWLLDKVWSTKPQPIKSVNGVDIS